jgi:hypothetical protein
MNMNIPYPKKQKTPSNADLAILLAHGCILPVLLLLPSTKSGRRPLERVARECAIVTWLLNTTVHHVHVDDRNLYLWSGSRARWDVFVSGLIQTANDRGRAEPRQLELRLGLGLGTSQEHETRKECSPRTLSRTRFLSRHCL